MDPLYPRMKNTFDRIIDNIPEHGMLYHETETIGKVRSKKIKFVGNKDWYVSMRMGPQPRILVEYKEHRSVADIRPMKSGRLKVFEHRGDDTALGVLPGNVII